MAEPLVRTALSISATLHEELKDNVPWGFRRHLLEVALRLIVEAAKRDGQRVLTDVMDGKYELRRKRKRTA